MIFELDGVTKRYGGHEALRNVTVAVRPGAIGLLGPNGAGKSTLIKLLLGLVKLTAGTAKVLGLDTARDSRAIRQVVGYMPEDDCHVVGLRGVEMVAYAGQLAGMAPRTALRRAHEMLDYVRLHDSRYREVQTYSTGMKARVKLATALIHSPQLVFLDEPTSGLDPEGREQILALIRSLASEKGVSVVVSTHILHDIERSCEWVLILGHGQLLVYDSLENLNRAIDASYQVRLGDAPDGFAEELRRSGLEVETIGADELRVAGDDVPARVFALARARRMPVRRLAPNRKSLEEAFLKAVRGDRAGP
jgi:ABC-2 type transport system ATP-binding protein